MGEINQEKRDKDYNYYARIQPAYISLLFPLSVCLLLFHKYSSVLSGDNLVQYIFDKLVYLGFVTPALFFLYRFLLRDISKLLIERFLFKLFTAPTIKLMLSDNSIFSRERKQEIRQLVREKYQISLNPDDDNYKTRLNEAVGQIRESTRSNSILFEYNYIYGFYRNLSAGVLLNVIFSVLLLILNCYYELNYTEVLLNIFLFLLLAFLMLLVLMYSAGITYAKRLYEVFLFLEKNN